MHVILAPTRIRAAAYAAGLGLADNEWSPVAGPSKTLHLLPGLDPEVAENAASRTNGRVVDHT